MARSSPARYAPPATAPSRLVRPSKAILKVADRTDATGMVMTDRIGSKSRASGGEFEGFPLDARRFLGSVRIEKMP